MFKNANGKLCLVVAKQENYYIIMQLFGREFAVIKDLEINAGSYKTIKHFDNVCDAVDYFETFMYT